MVAILKFAILGTFSTQITCQLLFLTHERYLNKLMPLMEDPEVILTL